MDNDLFNDVSDNLDDALFLDGQQEPKVILEQPEDDVQVINTADDLFLEDDNTLRDIGALDDYLHMKGITNSKIKLFNEETNQEEEIDFYSLSKDEQLEVLMSLDTQPEPMYSQDEESFLSALRENNLTIDQYLDYYKESILEELNASAVQSYDIDSYSDQELFLLDLKNRFDFDEEKLKSELEKELTDEDTFKIKVDKLREEYKELEDRHKAEEQQKFENEKKQQYNQFADAMVTVATNHPELHGFELEDNDKNETLNYILQLDNNGQSQFYKDLDKPENIYRIAWYMKYGDEAFNMVQDVYEKEISRLKQQLNRQDKRAVVRQRPQTKNNSNFI